MGRLVTRCWDEESFSSRLASPNDDPACRFDAFVPHPLAHWQPDLNSVCLERVMVAEDALRRLGQHQSSTEGAALAAEWLVLRAESAASSTIEGVHPSARRLARAEAQLNLFGEQPRPDDREALRNIAAVEHALAIASEARPLTAADIASVHRVLMGDDDPAAGQIRTRQNWIGPGLLASTPLNASFVPPPPEEVPALMDDLVERVNNPVGHPLVDTAVVHAQFEMIHPFGDGNGRTGRALAQMMLMRSRLAPPCTLPVSSSLALRKEHYIASLSEAGATCPPDGPARSLAIRPWITLFADAAADAARYAERLIADIAHIAASWRQQLEATGARRRTAAWRLLDYLPSHPVLNAEKAAELLHTSWRTGARSLTQLEQAGILVQRSAGRRNRVYEADAITDAFADATRLSTTQTERS